MKVHKNEISVTRMVESRGIDSNLPSPIIKQKEFKIFVNNLEDMQNHLKNEQIN